MTKEVMISLSTPPEELPFLVQALSRALGSVPLATKEAMMLVYLLTDETDDAVTRAKIEPCIGAFVNEVAINELPAK